jgi:protein TonB
MIRSLFAILLFYFLPGQEMSAQGTTASSDTGIKTLPDSARVFTVAEQMPEYPGGTEMLQRFLSENIKYPPMESENGIQGTVFITFIINRKGEIKDIRVMKGVKDGPGLEKESLRVIKLMPNWIPGKMNGKPVNVQFSVPVKYTIYDGKKRRRKK